VRRPPLHGAAAKRLGATRVVTCRDKCGDLSLSTSSTSVVTRQVTTLERWPGTRERGGRVCHTRPRGPQERGGSGARRGLLRDLGQLALARAPFPLLIHSTPY
jgi:hypothetical protein